MVSIWWGPDQEYADNAEEATKVARENGKDAALKKAAKLDEDAKRAAKRARKAAKRISGGENNDDNCNDEHNNGGVGDSAGKNNDRKNNKDAGQKNHVESVMRMLASGPCSKMAKNIFSSLKINYSANGNKVYGPDHMYNVLLAACRGNDKRRPIDGQCRILQCTPKRRPKDTFTTMGLWHDKWRAA